MPSEFRVIEGTRVEGKALEVREAEVRCFYWTGENTFIEDCFCLIGCDCRYFARGRFCLY